MYSQNCFERWLGISTIFYPRTTAVPQKTGLRLNDYPGFQGRYNSPRMRSQLDVYQKIASKYDMSVHQLATAFVHNK